MERVIIILLSTALVIAWVLWRRSAAMRAARPVHRPEAEGHKPRALSKEEEEVEGSAWCATPFLLAEQERQARLEPPRPSPMMEALRREKS